MFYLKHRGRKLYIRVDNVFTICPDCGQEFAVDIQGVFSEMETDVCGTAVYCEDCSAQRADAILSSLFKKD